MIQFVFAASFISLSFFSSVSSANSSSCGASLQGTSYSDEHLRALAVTAVESDFIDDANPNARPKLLAYGVDAFKRRGPRSATVTMILEVDHESTAEPVILSIRVDGERVSTRRAVLVTALESDHQTLGATRAALDDERVRGVFRRATRRYLDHITPGGVLRFHTKVLHWTEEGRGLVAKTSAQFLTKARPDFWDEEMLELRYDPTFGFAVLP